MLIKRKHAWYLGRSLALSFGYLLLGMIGLNLTISAQFASPFFPAAGLALAALISWGWRYVPAVLLGSLGVNAWLQWHQGLPVLWTVPAIALFCGLQALAGAALVRRFCSRPLVLTQIDDLLRFGFWGAMLPPLISAGLGTAALLLSGELPRADAWDTAFAWWLGDFFGCLVTAPMLLTLIGRPRKAWAARRLTVGLPLLLCCFLVGLAIMAVMQRDVTRSRGLFERDSLDAAEKLDMRLREARLALEGLRSTLLVTPQPGRPEFQRATAAFLGEGSALRALGFAQRVPRADLAAFERAARADGLSGYHAYDRTLPDDVDPPAGEDMVVIRLIEPAASNAGALGVNVRSVSASRITLASAINAGEARATPGFRLSQDGVGNVGVVIYQPIYEGQPDSPEDRKTALRAAAFATLRPDRAMDRMARFAAPYLQFCLIDDDGGRHERLAGPLGCETASTAKLFVSERHIDMAGRDWLLRVTADAAANAGNSMTLPFAVAGLVATGLLGMMLLTVSGRARIVEDLVHARTAALTREMAERVEAAQALGMSEQRFSTIFANAPIGIGFVGVSGRVEEANPQACRLIGRSLAELQCIHTAAFIHPDDLPEMRRLTIRMLHGGMASVQHQLRLLRPDGTEQRVRLLVRLLRGADGRLLHFLAVIEDISDEQRVKELERARQAAELANQAKTDFLSRMSHELRTPLNAMLGFVQLMEMDPQERLSDRQQARTQQIGQAGWHLLAMINDMLDLSRIEAGVLGVQIESLDLPQLLQEVLALVDAPAREHGITIHLALSETAHWLAADSTRLKQVLTNLLSNAVKYNREGGEVTVTGRLDGTQVQLEVRDTGLGMSADQMEQLFKPFNRLGRERSQTEGTGIGLTISKRLSELMGGTLEAASVEGQGSVFTLRLPAGLPPDAGEDPALADAPQRLGPRRIVYVEDNRVNAAVMRGVFEQRPGFELQICETGTAGLAALDDPEKGLPDLLLLDMQLPDIDGEEVLRRLRRRWSATVLPVIVISANALPGQVAAVNALGVLHYLTKPVDVPALLLALDQALMKRSPTPSAGE